MKILFFDFRISGIENKNEECILNALGLGMHLQYLWKYWANFDVLGLKMLVDECRKR
jgi:hypothetical protein